MTVHRTRIRTALACLAHSDGLDGLDEELAFHLERCERDLLACGLNEHAARREAHRRFGDVARARRRTAWTIRKERVMLKITAALGLLGTAAAVTIGLTSWPSPMEGWARVAPFTALRAASADEIEIRLDGAWWTLDAVEGVAAHDLHAAAASAFGHDDAERRMTEDLVEVLAAAGVDAGTHVDLRLRPVAGGPVMVFLDQPLTADNRRAARSERRTRLGLDRHAANAAIVTIAPARPDTWVRVAPFAALVLRDDGGADVLVQGSWFELRAVDGVPTPDLIAAAANAFGPDRIHKRLSEDLHEVLEAATGVPTGGTVHLSLNGRDGVVHELDHAAMTASLGRAVRAHNRGPTD